MDDLNFDFQKILVGIDGSEYSMNAARLGTLLAKKYGARLYLVNVIDFPGYSAISDPSVSKTVESVIDSLNQRQGKRRKNYFQMSPQSRQKKM